MSNKTHQFFKGQTEITKLKIKVLSEYITGYYPKLLLSFKKCTIIDLFSGPGKSGNNLGSPLQAIEQAKYILQSPILKELPETPKIYFFFNDINSAYTENLQDELSKIQSELPKNIIYKVTNYDYKEILPKLIQWLKEKKIPSFIFLDPFTYSQISVFELKKLMDLPHIEIMLFIPISHVYRFSGSAPLQKNEEHKTRRFLEEYTKSGIKKYKDPFDLLNDIRAKLRKELKTDYVRYTLLNTGIQKNALIFITKHRKGMILMNKKILLLSSDGSSNISSSTDQLSLFDNTFHNTQFQNFKNSLIEKIKSCLLKTNEEIVEYTIKEGYLPKHAKEILLELFRQNKIIFMDENGNEIRDRRKWNIAEQIKKQVIIKYHGC